VKIFKKVFLVFFLAFLQNCSLNESFLTEQKDGWFSNNDAGLIYCRANVKNDGSADPVCFETGFERYQNENSANQSAKKRR